MPSKEPPLNGLVLIGGKSTRMNSDKALLSYHGKPHAAHCYDLLSNYCDRVYLSTRSDSPLGPALESYPVIKDVSGVSGPMAGILAAFEENPDAAWLVLAGDLPYVTDKTLRALVASRDVEKCATAYTSPEDGKPEPLCAIYEPRSRAHRQGSSGKGDYSPRNVLGKLDVFLLCAKDSRELRNVNTPGEYVAAIQELQRNQ